MTRRIFTISTLMLLAMVPAGAGEVPDAIEAPSDLGSFLRFYYTDPSPELVDNAIRFLSSRRGLEGTDAGALVIGFFGQVFHDNQDKVERWSQIVENLDPTTRATMNSALAFSVSPRQAAEDAPPNVQRNELCWGAFFASGDPAYLNMIIARLRHLPERENLNLYVTAAAAQWSLATHAADHPRVREALEKAKDDASPEFLEALVETLESSPDEIRGRSIAVLDAQREAGVW